MCFYNITYFSFVCLHVLHVHVKQVNLCRLSSWFFFFFQLQCMTCRILVPPAVEAGSPNHWAPREFPPTFLRGYQVTQLYFLFPCLEFNIWPLLLKTELLDKSFFIRAVNQRKLSYNITETFEKNENLPEFSIVRIICQDLKSSNQVLLIFPTPYFTTVLICGSHNKQILEINFNLDQISVFSDCSHIS